MPEIFIEDPSLNDIPFAPLRDVYDIWRGMMDTHGLAQRKHFTPQVLKDHLPFLVFVDHEADTGRFRVRLIGTSYTEAIGFETTGMYVDEMPNTEEMQTRYRWLVDTAKPYYAYLDQMTWAGQDYRHYAVIGCPLFDDAGRVNMILFRVTFERMDNHEQFGPAAF